VTITTVGYGDLTPTNIHEVTFLIFSVILGCASFAYFMNSVAVILNDYEKKEIEFRR